MRLWVLGCVAAAVLAAVGPACERTAPGTAPGTAPAARGAPAPPAEAEAPVERPPAAQASERRGDRHARAAARRAPGVKRISGSVARAGGRSVAIRAGGAPPLTLRVSPSTTITVDGRPAGLEALREGAEVRASYRTGGGRPTAVAIEARTPPAPAAEPGGASWGTSPDPPPDGGG